MSYGPFLFLVRFADFRQKKRLWKRRESSKRHDTLRTSPCSNVGVVYTHLDQRLRLETIFFVPIRLELYTASK